MNYISKPEVMTVENQRKTIFALKRAYPFLKIGVIGKSLCQRGIFVLDIGRGGDPLLIAAGFHGQEWSACLDALRFAEILLRSRACRRPIWGISPAALGREVLIVPCVNPDGVQIAVNGADGAGKYSGSVSEICAASDEKWNANARGVDINHNFDAGWDKLREIETEAGILGPSPRRYGGYKPESEPETASLVALCKSRRPAMALALHSQGEELFWRYGENVPPRSEILARILSAASGYKLVENDGLASSGGFKDWFIERFNRPAFTVEIGLGTNPLLLADFEKNFEKLLPLLTLALVLASSE